ncbi:ATP synthase F0 subunit 6 (mitochondrion) [Galendromus occidentalis]|uniref:ATP synthase subunit a n=1 Tax=Galendromus occidentalis TaxID=34638 RepID=A3RE54_9ACAR|nr:ATP synthase F0 subunit 6 [Galendromus occidentalis]ABN45842.1 ATPase subunit 6 [Galendromus occidentalis]
MMNNMFSMFDPASQTFFFNNWVAMFVLLLIFPKNLFFQSSRYPTTILLINKSMFNNLMNNVKKSQILFMNILISLFLLISVSNLMSLFPFIFTPTSHLSISLSMAMPLWLNLFLKSWIFNPLKSFSHLVPLNTPILLCPFMVIIETISSLIRPITLSIRLSTNMIAGHILISLLSTMLGHSMLLFSTIFFILIILMMLETAVAVIQSYVFITLISLYLSETN